MEATVDIKKLADLVLPLKQQLPRTVTGIERHAKIGEIVEHATEDVRMQMKAILDFYLDGMEKNEASDIDMGGPGCGGHVWYRVHGDKNPVENDVEYSIIETDFLLHNVLMPQQRKYLLEHRNLDFSYMIRENEDNPQRFRADMYFDLAHLGLNMRRIDNNIRPFTNLGLHPEVAKSLSLKYLKYGMTLITGITGSGKSSTLDSIIDANNRTLDSHIIIIASPVELIHKPVRSIVRHREVGRDVTSFKNGAIQALRQDPDIIMIGELRDPETIMTALEITDSGHKTFSTLHTSSAMESIDRIIGEVPVNEQNRVRNRLADVLTCVISQKLVPSIDGKRVLTKEVLVTTPSVKAAIRNNNVGEIYQMLMEGSSYGMLTMEQDLKNLYEEGKITRENAINYANNKKRISELISYIN